MEKFLDQIIDLYEDQSKNTSSSLIPKQPPSYLDIKNGHLPLQISYPEQPFSPHPREPCLILSSSHSAQPSIMTTILSSQISTPLSINDYSQPPHESIENRITDHLIKEELLNTSLKYLKNENGLIHKIEEQLVSIMEQERINVNSFSENCLTNISKWDFQGNMIDIETINIDKESKNYVEDYQGLVDKMPHPIRGKRNRKKNLSLDKEKNHKKSQREVKEQFEILSEIFSIENGGLKGGFSKNAENREKQKQQQKPVSKETESNRSKESLQRNAKEVLDLVSLVDGTGYSDLWDEIIGELKLDSNRPTGNQNPIQTIQTDEKKQPNQGEIIIEENLQSSQSHSSHLKVNNKAIKVETLEDKKFKEIVNRIMNEATEYQQQAFILSEDEGSDTTDENNDDQASENNRRDDGIDGKEKEQEMTKEEQIQQVVREREEKARLQKEKADEKGFEAVRIAKAVCKADSSKYQYAVEDTSDLADFYDHLPKQKFAFQYPFQLDEFQKRSILHLQKKQSVFVAAHTSAGKTVIAQYAIALATRHKRKVIYTSPIKALSNQKYRELSNKFPSVGIVTGDVTLNQSATCVIMTTQILRNNLYRGAEMIRDIQWVIFDEVHYINNQDRGVVWEQTIIMLPEHIGIVMLSATVPNYMQFANWVGRTKRRVVFVMKTFHRPVPLQHSLYIFGKFHTIKEANGKFLEGEYRHLKHQINLNSKNQEDLKLALKEEKKKKIEETGQYKDKRKEQKLKLMNKQAVDKFIKKITKGDMENAQGRQEHRILEELIEDCRKKNLLPAVVFTFSKKKINTMAGKIYSYDLTSKSQKSKIQRVISHALSNLRPQDRQIEQFQFLTMICMNGYAVHHGDLLPLAKQIVELLFSQGLIKVLFATETFAMGINMPTKTVIYNSIKKPTGSDGSVRFLNSSEYVQMSGRAGRRGLDQKGTVIIIVNNPNNLPDCQEMIKMIDHPGQRLQSKFRVTYKIILNLYNSKDMNVTQMMRQSFLENPKFSQYTSNIKKTKQFKNLYEQLSDFNCPYNKMGTRILIEEYNTVGMNLRDVNGQLFREYDFNKKLTLPRYVEILGLNNQIQIGLLLRIDTEMRKNTYSSQRQESITPAYVQIMIVNELYLGLAITKEEREEDEKKLGLSGKKRIKLKYDGSSSYVTGNSNLIGGSTMKQINGMVQGTNNKYHYYVYWIRPQQIITVYENRLTTFKRPIEQNNKQIFSQVACELLPQNIPQKLQPSEYKLSEELLNEKSLYAKQFAQSYCHNCQKKQQHQQQFEKRIQTKKLVKESMSKINKNDLGLLGSFDGMIKLLKDYGFVKDETLSLKGRIAKQVDIYVAQVIVEAVLDPLNPAQLAALMSAFVCDFKPRISNFNNQNNPFSNDKQPQMHQFTPLNPSHHFTEPLQNAIHQTLDIITSITNKQISSQAYTNVNSQDQLLFSIINFHLCDTVYKWAIGYDFTEAIIGSKAPQGTIVRTIVRLNQLLENVKGVCRLMGNSQLEKKIGEATELIKRDIVFCQSLYLTG